MTSEAHDLVHMTDEQLDALYQERIEPLLGVDERSRAAGVAAFKKRMTLGAAAALILGAAVFLVCRQMNAALIISAIVGSVGFAIVYMPLQRMSQRLRSELLAATADAVGVTYRGDGVSPNAFHEFVELDLVPGHDLAQFGNLLLGVRMGRVFELCNVTLKRTKGDTHSYTIFCGILIRAELSAIEGESGANTRPKSLYSRSAAIKDQLESLRRALRARSVSHGFQRDTVWAAFESEETFDFDGAFKAFGDAAHARKIMTVIAKVMKLMDATPKARRVFVGRERACGAKKHRHRLTRPAPVINCQYPQLVRHRPIDNEIRRAPRTDPARLPNPGEHADERHFS